MRLLKAICVAAWGALAFVPAGRAKEVLPPETGISDVISDQIEAFREDDFFGAFQFASPNIQTQFGTPDRFGAMVRNGYPMVWRPGDVRFGALREVDGQIWQEVLITDEAGKRFGLAYRMERVLGEWKIGGVMVIPAPDVAV